MHVGLTSILTLCREIEAHMLESKPTTWSRHIGSLLSYQGGITVAAYAASISVSRNGIADQGILERAGQ